MKIFKSKTLDFNIIVGALFALGMGFGYEVPADVIAAVALIGNFILRFFTKDAVADK